MPFPEQAKKEAIADKYGWKVMGWAVDLDNPAGISLYSKWDSHVYLRMQHKDSLKVWEATLKKNAQKKPKFVRPPPKPITFDAMQFALKRIAELEPGSKGAYGKFVEAQKIAREAIGWAAAKTKDEHE